MHSSLVLRLTLCLALIFCVGVDRAKAQENFKFRADVHTGLVLPEYSQMLYLVNAPVVGAEFSLCRLAKPTKYWNQLYRFPEYGFTFQFTSLGNQQVLGYEYAVFPYFTLPLVRKQSFLFYQQYGFGVGYATKKFDLTTNYQNVAVGSHFNAHFSFKLGVKWNLDQRKALNGGLFFTHYSNANMAEPNLGLNFAGVYAGIQIGRTNATPSPTLEVPAHVKKNEFAVVTAFGGKHTRALQSDIYQAASITFEYKRHVYHKVHVGGGLDFSYDSSTQPEMAAKGKYNFKPIDNYRSGIHVAQEFVYAQFSFILQEGVYIGLTDKVNNHPIYTKAVVRYKVNAHWLLHFAMRSHLHILDYPEIAIGYRIE